MLVQHGPRTEEQRMKKNMALKEVAQLLGVQPYRVQYAITHGAVAEPKERMSGTRCVYDPQTVRRLAAHFDVQLPESEV